MYISISKGLNFRLILFLGFYDAFPLNSLTSRLFLSWPIIAQLVTYQNWQNGPPLVNSLYPNVPSWQTLIDHPLFSSLPSWTLFYPTISNNLLQMKSSLAYVYRWSGGSFQDATPISSVKSFKGNMNGSPIAELSTDGYSLERVTWTQCLLGLKCASLRTCNANTAIPFCWTHTTS